MREIVFDTETTGLDPANGDRMVEIGCIELFNRVPTGAVFHAYFNPQRDMPPGAEAVHGLSISFLGDKPLFADTAGELLEFLGEAPLVAHNAGFDFGFLNAELARTSYLPVCTSRMVDTIALARKRHPGAKLSLDALCTRYGIDRSHRVRHGALLDAELLAQVYVELTGGRQIGLELAADGGPQAQPPARAIIPGGSAVEGPLRQARPHSPTTEELERHRSFLETIKSPLWTS